jgi:hypothetical protein
MKSGENRKSSRAPQIFQLARIFISHEKRRPVKKTGENWVPARAKAQGSLVQRAVEAFRASTGLDLRVNTLPAEPGSEPGWQLLLRTEPGAMPRVFQAVVRSVEQVDALGAAQAALHQGSVPGVLVLSRASEPVAEQCQAMGLPFIDGQGNAYLQQKDLLIVVKGQKPPRVERGARAEGVTGRASTATGLKLVFALLSEPALTLATTQILHEAAGVALGSVPAVLGDLEQRGLLVRRGWGKGWHVRNWSQLLEMWASEYPVRLRPRLRSLRFRSPGQGLWWQRADPQRCGGQWSGEVAAHQLGTVLKPEKALLYLPEPALRQGLAQLMQAEGLRSDPTGDVEVVEAFWDPNRIGGSGACVPLPLVIADLQASLDPRNIEAAAELKEIWRRAVEA